MNDHHEPADRPDRDASDRPARGSGRREVARTRGRPAPLTYPRGLRVFALLTVIGGVVALAAAAFVFSYAGVHAIAIEAGVPSRLARLFPALPDAVLVVACAAALMLRGARWWTRSLAWLSILVIVALAGTADAVHAMAIKLPRRPTAAGAAALPWALLLLSVWLWLSVMRHARHSAAPSPRPERAAGTAPEPAVSPDGAFQASEPAAAPQAALAQLTRAGNPQAEPTPSAPPRDEPADDDLDTAAELAIDAEPEPDDPASGDDVGPRDASDSDSDADSDAESRLSSGRHAREEETPHEMTIPLLSAPVTAQASAPEPPAESGPGGSAAQEPPAVPDQGEAAADEPDRGAPDRRSPHGEPAADFRRVRSSPLRPGNPGK